MDGYSGTAAPRMDWESLDLPATWRSFKQHVEFTFGGPLKKKSEEEKCNYLMIWVGEKGRDVFNTWTIPDEDRGKLKTYFDRFEAHVQPKSNTVFMRYKFNLKVQSDQESIDQFVTDLRLLAKHCSYGANADEMVRDRIVFGCRSKKVRESLIKEGSELTLETAIDIARTQELAQAQLRKMDVAAEEMNTVGSFPKARERDGKKNRGKSDKPPKAKRQHSPPKDDRRETAQCQRCGRNHKRQAECRAMGKLCRKCNKMNHFAQMCKTKQVNTVEDSTDSEDELYVGSIDSNS